jgi:hypothetical protein
MEILVSSVVTSGRTSWACLIGTLDEQNDRTPIVELPAMRAGVSVGREPV